MFRKTATIAAAALLTALPAAAQHAGHDNHAAHTAPAQGTTPREAGNAVFAALAEVIALLEADPSTDWSTVSIERLRLHLVDMNDVALNARVQQQDVTGGATMDVTGNGSTIAAIRRMTTAHAHQTDLLPGTRVAVSEIPGGARVTVTADDASTVARVRALGFIGLLVYGNHHAPHHIAIAKGGPRQH